MNFREFYQTADRILNDAIISLWATGDARMQDYIRYVLKSEKLLAEPVFQTMFPWELFGSDMNSLIDHGIFTEKFLKALDRLDSVRWTEPDGFPYKSYCFKSDTSPYKHQVESWEKLLIQKKSIVVTTGTGSGKTECFMLPVLQDLTTVKESEHDPAVRAIFLYPLNALIGSQKKRVHAWTKSIGNVTYGIYNGKTPEDAASQKAKEKHAPEIISRSDLRSSPPDILFTNPTMLEYMLVRDKDAPILEKSNGKLRWIILDETHTLSGSVAAEMALLLRRVLDAFGVEPAQVRFVATSATVGGSNKDALTKFMSYLTGKSESDIHIVSGKRILPEYQMLPDEICKPDDFRISAHKDEKIKAIRNNILQNEVLSATEISAPFSINGIENQLDLVTSLSHTKNVLPVRGHFFIKGIGGLYACTNPQCSKHGERRPVSALGTLTASKAPLCDFCNSPMLEMVACNSCNNHLITGEKYLEGTLTKFRIPGETNDDPFSLDFDNDDDATNREAQSDHGDVFYAARTNENFNADHLFTFSLNADETVNPEGDDYTEAFNDQDEPICPYCKAKIENPFHFRISSVFMNRVLTDAVLEQTPELNSQDAEASWYGHRYIAFMDSRQGSSKVSALLNIDAETNWVRSQVFHKLSSLNQPVRLTENERAEKIAERKRLIEEIGNCPPALQPGIITRMAAINEELEERHRSARLPWQEITRELLNKTELNKIFNFNRRNALPEERVKYLTAVLFNEFARKLQRKRSLENLGLVKIVFPDLEHSRVPELANTLGISDEDWRNFLKIAADFIVRNGFHFILPNGTYRFFSDIVRSDELYPPNSPLEHVKKWPQFNDNAPIQPRLVLLLCAGLGWHSFEELRNNTLKIDQLNSILGSAWNEIRNNILSLDDQGFKVNLEEKVSFELPEQLWLCPAKKRFLDTHFKGYSPWMTGRLDPDNLMYFRIETQPLTVPHFPYPYCLGQDGTRNDIEVSKWLSENSAVFRNVGVWNNLHERIYLNKPLLLAGEHSAQQNPLRLKEFEEMFEKGKLNVLSCSTTMEMGVDIGGISAVVMNNVPPSPLNYLQRTGRAGRRQESRSLALTFCSDNPIGASAMNNPKWAIEHRISPPVISLNSPVIAERHVNAFFWSKFIRERHNGLNIREVISEVFFTEGETVAESFIRWMDTTDINQLSASIRNIVHITALENENPESLRLKTLTNFEELTFRTKRTKYNLEEKKTELINEFGENSPAVRAISYKISKFLHTPVLGYFGEQGFLPTAGMPTGVMSFDTVSWEDFQKNDDDKKIMNLKPEPSHDLIRALSEYAPGSDVVIDGWNYKSSGIVLHGTWNSHNRFNIQACRHCGYQRIISDVEGENFTQCPHCGQNSMSGIDMKGLERKSSTQVIEPAGFAVDIRQRPSRKITEKTIMHHIDTLLLGMEPWRVNGGAYQLREGNEDSEILYYNLGAGNGFSVCLHCGRADTDRGKLTGHTRLRGGRTIENDTLCSGNNDTYAIKDNVLLGGRIKTDLVELRFLDENQRLVSDDETIWSLGVVLTKSLAINLGIEEDELDFGIKSYRDCKSVFIFDTDKGGAGYSVQFPLVAKDVFETARDMLRCTCTKACTKCLIDRKSQWFINKLDRNKALALIEFILRHSVPAELEEEIPGIRSVLGTVTDEINRHLYRNEISEIWLYGSSTISQWDMETFPFKKLKYKALVNTRIVLRSVPNNLDIADYISLIQLKGWVETYIDANEYGILKPICRIKLNNGSYYHYYSLNDNCNLAGEWGSEGPQYFCRSDSSVSMQRFDPEMPATGNRIQEIKLEIVDRSFQSSRLADLIFEKYERMNELKEIMSGKTYNVTCSDRYLRTPLGCLLLLQFIKRIERLTRCAIGSIIIKTLPLEESYKVQEKIYHDYGDDDSRAQDIRTFSDAIGLPEVRIETNGLLAHARSIEFTSDGFSLLIRPDAGIEHGWRAIGSTDLRDLDIGNIKLLKRVTYPLYYYVSENEA